MYWFSGDFFKSLEKGVVDFRTAESLCSEKKKRCEMFLRILLFFRSYPDEKTNLQRGLTNQFVIIDTGVGHSHNVPRIHHIFGNFFINAICFFDVAHDFAQI